MMVHLFMALLLVQQPRVPFQVPRDSVLPASVRQSVEGGFPMEGQITWEGGAETTSVDVELRGADESTVIGRMEATANGRFRFNNVRYGTYWIVIESERYNYVRQRVIVDNSTFAIIRVDVSLFPRTVAEGGDLVAAVAALQVNIPKKAFEVYEEALEEFQKDNEDEGIDRLKDALEMVPDYYDAHLELGYAYQRAGDAEQAIVSLARAVEINPASRDGLSWLGRLYYETEQFQGALDALRRRMDLGAASEDDSFYIGSTYYRLEALAEAEENLLRSIAIAPESSGVARLQLSNVYMRRGQPVLALEQIEAYISEHPGDPNLEAYQKRVDDLRQTLNQGPPPG